MPRLQSSAKLADKGSIVCLLQTVRRGAAALASCYPFPFIGQSRMRMFLFCPKDPATKPGYSVRRNCGPTMAFVDRLEAQQVQARELAERLMEAAVREMMG